MNRSSQGLFRVAVRDRFMIAHSFRGEVFGPTQRLHGATYEVTSEYATDELDPNNIVLDMGLCHEVLAEALAPLRFRNLDELPQFAGINTTTEFLSRWIHEQIAKQMRGKFRGQLRITLDESTVAWASYEGPVA